MNLADAIILFVIAISALLSLRRGFTREAFSLLTWVAAFIIARLFSPALDVLLVNQIETPSLRMIVAFGSLFVITLVLGGLMGHVLGRVIHATGLTSTDRLLGMIFGALRGVLLMVVIVAIGQHFFAEDAWWQSSVLVPHLAMLELWTRQVGEEIIAFVINVSESQR